MSVYYSDDHVALYHGDCLDVLAAMPDSSVDSIVTDPPYGLSNTTPAQVAETITRWVSGDREYLPAGRGFMGKEWDGFVPPVAVWDECLRVLKPGGHMAVFAGSRTHDLMTLSIRFAGFEIRDSLAWLYGSGFPKGIDVSKAIDKARREDAEPVKAVAKALRAALDASGKTRKEIDSHFGTANVSQYWFSPHRNPQVPPVDKWPWLRDFLGADPSLDAEVWRLNGRKGTPGEAWEKREVTGVYEQPSAANEWAGNYRGTKRAGIKERRDIPATSEAARWNGWNTTLKPSFEPIVFARKSIEGTVAENVLAYGTGGLNIDACRIAGEVHPAGRWPANVLLDENTADHLTEAARFFYVAKAPKSERPNVDGIQHPTVKPLALMQWLTRLITPPGGTILDPFAGSGTTIEAAMTEGFHPIGIEKETDYLPLITARITRAKTSTQGVLDLGGIA